MPRRRSAEFFVSLETAEKKDPKGEGGVGSFFDSSTQQESRHFSERHANHKTMELRELLRLFWKSRAAFVLVFASVLLVAALIYAVQPISYRAEVTMNVARAGVRETSDYTFDDFYRLQADERFADTVVRWLESPRVVSDIERAAGLSLGSLSFDAGRLSSQVIRVRFMVRDRVLAERVSREMFSVLNRETNSLNGKNRSDGWFALVGEEPSLSDGRISLGTVLLGGVATGLFLGILWVLCGWYVRGESEIESARRGRSTRA